MRTAEGSGQGFRAEDRNASGRWRTYAAETLLSRSLARAARAPPRQKDLRAYLCHARTASSWGLPQVKSSPQKGIERGRRLLELRTCYGRSTILRRRSG